MITWLFITSWIWGWFWTVVLRMSIDNFRSDFKHECLATVENIVIGENVTCYFAEQPSIWTILTDGCMEPEIDILGFLPAWPVFIFCASKRLRFKRKQRIEVHNVYATERMMYQRQVEIRAFQRQQVVRQITEEMQRRPVEYSVSFTDINDPIPRFPEISPPPKIGIEQPPEPIDIEAESILQRILRANRERTNI